MQNEKKQTKKAKAVLLILIIILLCPFYISRSKSDDTFHYRSVLFSYDRSMHGSPEPHSLDSEYSVVNYRVETKVRILFIPVYNKATEYEGWLRTEQ